MNRVCNLLLAAVFVVALCGCDATEEENLDQRDDIISYLESSHIPKLISESAAKTSLDENPAFYSTTGHTTFRYISTYYDTDRESKTTIKKGSKIEVTLSLYDFTDMTTPSASTVLISNDADVIDELIVLFEDRFTGEYWSSDPISLTVGDGSLFEGVENLLVGCKNEDIIEFYMTLDEAYGLSLLGVVTEQAPLALFCKILTVNN